ncbi:hypothetical protein KDL44_08700 [bacterium]|nr:hypothetical protein [bacterium]
MKTCCLVLLAMLAVMMMASCGGGGAGIALQPDGILPSGTDVPANAMEGLPDLTELQEPGRSISGAEQGWYDISLYQTYRAERSQGVEIDNGLLEFDAGNGIAWQLWGVSGFSPETKPAAIATSVSAVEGEYYIGVADYRLGRWQFHGPYSESMQLDHDPAAATPALSNLLQDGRRHYVALLATEGSSLKLESVSIGLASDGGAPPAGLIACSPGDDYIMVHWNNTDDYEDLDFAGYSIERAGLFSGEFHNVSGEPLRGNSWVDQDVEQGMAYRYRMRYHSMSGASSVSAVDVCSTEPGANNPPVCVMQLTEGPFAGPAEVTIDLSGSYDPDGDQITNYSFNFGFGKGVVNQSTPVLTTALQPGSYNISGSVSDGSVGVGYSFATITVYPQWKAQPSLVEAAQETSSRVHLASAGMHTPSGMLCTLYFDMVTNNIAMLEEDADGNVEEHQLFGATGQLLSITEAAEFDGKLFWSVCDTSERRSMVCWDGDALYKFELDMKRSFTALQDLLVSFAGRLLLIHARSSLPRFHIRARDVFTGEDFTLDEYSFARFKACVDPAGEHLDLLLEKDEGGFWVRFDGDFNLIGSQALPEVLPLEADMIADPATRDLYLVYRGSPKMEIRTLPYGDSSWSLPTVSSVLMLEDSRVRLFFRDGRLLLVLQDLFANAILYDVTVGGISKLYSIDDFVFPDRFWLSAGRDAELRYVGLDYSPGAASFVDVTAEGMEVAHEIRNTSLLGAQLQAVRAGNSLVVSYYRNRNALHRTSFDGQTFNDGATFAIGGRTQLTTDGFVAFIGNSQDGSAEYARINGNQYDLKVTETLHDDEALPLHGGSLNAQWYCQRNFASYFMYGSNGWEFDNVESTRGRSVWRGVIGGSPGLGFGAIAITDSDKFDDGQQHVSILNYPYNGATTLHDAHPMILARNHMDGRRLDYCPSKKADGNSRHHYYCGTDEDGRAMRISLDKATYSVVQLPLESADIRRTVSGVYAHGSAGLGLVADNNGEDVYLEWDILGDFERLDTPDFGWSNMHEIVVGPDGRWHILYHDQASDSIMIWSTI